MRVEKFNSNKSDKISNLISKNYPSISYNQIMKLFRNKDIKVNGKRVSKDIVINANDEVLFYISDEKLKVDFDIIYEDENIVVIFKPRKIEVENETENCIVKMLSNQLNQELFAVHRLDMNTTGLLIFAKNIQAKLSLDSAFKNRTLNKFYIALVSGRPEKNKDDLVAYLKKYENKSMVEISNFPQKGYEKIETKYKIVDFNENLSILEVELITGKTHQIRAHLSHIGCPIIGDEKYGDSILNKEYKVKYQCLCAYKIVFKFKENDCLYYLNNKEILLENEKIDFLKFYK